MNSEELRDLTESYYNGVYSLSEETEEGCGSEYSEKEGKMKGSRKKDHEKKEREMKESQDLYDTVLEHLISEGYADDVQAAQVIMTHMSDQWLGNIMEASSRTIMSVQGPR